MKALAFTALGLMLVGGGMAQATPCRDGKGKFITCPKAAAPKKCRDAKGKFMSCGATPPMTHG